MPLDRIPLQCLDPFTMEQEEMVLVKQSRRPPQILRFLKDAVIKKHSQIQCAGQLQSGVLEVCAYLCVYGLLFHCCITYKCHGFSYEAM